MPITCARTHPDANKHARYIPMYRPVHSVHTNKCSLCICINTPSGSSSREWRVLRPGQFGVFSPRSGYCRPGWERRIYIGIAQCQLEGYLNSSIRAGANMFIARANSSVKSSGLNAHSSWERAVEFKFIVWSSIAQSVCEWTFSLLVIWCLRFPRFESCIQ